jgi:hypothetical protein
MMRKLAFAAILVVALVSVASAAQTPSPNLNDQQVLATDPTFQARSVESFIGYCFGTVLGENHGVPYHPQRAVFCQTVLIANGTGTGSWKTVLAQVAAANATVLSDATATGGTPLTSGNVAAQQAVVADTDLNNAIAAAFNLFIGQP